MQKTKLLGLAALLAAAPIAVTAGPGLRGIMHAWRDDARAMHEMLTGGTRFDAAAIRAALQGYVTDAATIESQLGAGTASARDFKHRFVAFEADAQAALGNLGQRPALTASVTRLLADCRSCHDVYNN